MELPFLYKGDKNVSLSLKEVSDLVKTLEQSGDLGGVLTASTEQGITIEIPPETVNFIKTHLFRAKAHKRSEEAHAVIASATRGKRCGGAGGDPV
ncbi:hypothetical protein [Serratia plymuthica]|uniref:hypothetical protein n=1 Tax=Serratia plymuthica TaxID=82996 RepID=UPI0018D75B21|nr:hypothetical protein [Serratia plymuthica]QPS57888.1 hypothetical protein I6G53_10480 [Serratia plymuthica]